MEHEFAASPAIVPKPRRRVEAGREAVVGGADHAVVVVQRGRANLPVRVLGAQAGHLGKSHRVLGNRQSSRIHGRSMASAAGGRQAITLRFVPAAVPSRLRA